MGEADDAAGDLRAAGLLLALYTLQGIPMGLSGAVPLLLAGRASYAEQALLSLELAQTIVTEAGTDLKNAIKKLTSLEAHMSSQAASSTQSV